MCRKVKDIKDEEINRLKEKYAHVLNGRLEMNVHKISNFVKLVIPTLAEQFKDQTLVRYNCLFSECIPQKRSYKSKQKYIQHLYLKHSNLLPGKGMFLLNHDRNICTDGFLCSQCGKNFKRKDHLQCHIKHVHNSSKISVSTKQNPINESEVNNNQHDIKNDNDIIILDETFSQCSLVDINLNITTENQDEKFIILD